MPIKIPVFLILSAMSAITLADSIKGITKPVRAVVIGAPVHGQLDAVWVNEGDQVQPGQVLINIDNRIETLEAEKLEKIWKDQSAAHAARIRRDTLLKVLETSKTLYRDGGSISREALDKDELDARQAEAEVQHLQISEEKERIEYELARTERDRRVIKSPIHGTVTRILRRAGERCQLAEPLIEVVDTNSGWFITHVDESMGRRLRLRQDVRLHLSTGDGRQTVRGKVVYLAPVLDAASGLMEVKVEFANPSGAIRLGATGTLSLN